MNGSSEAIARVEPAHYSGMTLAFSPAEAERRLQELRAFVQTAMVKGEDYGQIPGTDKPCLFKPGAEKLAEIYGLAHRFEVIDAIKDWEGGFFYFEYRTVLTSRRDGRPVGEGIGSCNSRESKYGARWAFERDIPEGMNKSTLKTKEITVRKDGPNKGKKILMFQIPNPDIYSLVNTLQKMACKRSYVMAVIAATRSAGLFTQDVEDQDIPEDAFGEAETSRSWDQDGAADPTDSIAGKLRAALSTARTIDELRIAWGGVPVAVRSKWITTEQADALVVIREARKAELEPAATNATPPGNAAPRPAEPGPQAAGAAPEPRREPAASARGAKREAPPPAAAVPLCVVCKAPTGADCVPTMGGVRHPTCALPAPAPGSVTPPPPNATGPKCGVCQKPTGNGALPFRGVDGGLYLRHPECAPPAPAREPDDGEPPPHVRTVGREPGED